MAYTLGGVVLPYGLLWADEISWTPIAQSQTWSLTGALIIETSIKQAGRPVTLTGAADRAWITQTTLDQLRALLDTDPLTLHTPDERTLSVRWDHAGPPISATPLLPRWPGAEEKYGSVVLKLIEI